MDAISPVDVSRTAKPIHPHLTIDILSQDVNHSPRSYRLPIRRSRNHTRVRCGCICAIIGLVELIASMFFLPLMNASAYIHVLGLALPLSIIVLALYPLAFDPQSEKRFRANAWLALSTLVLFAHLGFIYDCITSTMTFAPSPSMNHLTSHSIDVLATSESALRAAFNLGSIVLVCVALFGIVLAQVSYWDESLEPQSLDKQDVELLPVELCDHPDTKSIKHSASLSNLLSLERAILRKQRRESARAKCIIRSKQPRSSQSDRDWCTD